MDLSGHIIRVTVRICTILIIQVNICGKKVQSGGDGMCYTIKGGLMHGKGEYQDNMQTYNGKS